MPLPSNRRTSSNIVRMAAIFTAAQTIEQNPIFGVGSWSQLAEAADRHRQYTEDLGQTNDSETSTQAGHSTILQAWTEAGIFAALAFFYYFWRLLSAFKWMLSKPLDRFYAAELFFLVNGIWGCLFSPFNGAMRIYIGMTSCLCIILAEEQKSFTRNAAKRRQIRRQMEMDAIRGRSAPGLLPA